VNVFELNYVDTGNEKDSTFDMPFVRAEGGQVSIPEAT